MPVEAMQVTHDCVSYMIAFQQQLHSKGGLEHRLGFCTQQLKQISDTDHKEQVAVVQQQTTVAKLATQIERLKLKLAPIALVRSKLQTTHSVAQFNLRKVSDEVEVSTASVKVSMEVIP